MTLEIVLFVVTVSEGSGKHIFEKLPLRLMRIVDGAGFEPAASTMPTWRSYQADLPAH